MVWMTSKKDIKHAEKYYGFEALMLRLHAEENVSLWGFG